MVQGPHHIREFLSFLSLRSTVFSTVFTLRQPRRAPSALGLTCRHEQCEGRLLPRLSFAWMLFPPFYSNPLLLHLTPFRSSAFQCQFFRPYGLIPVSMETFSNILYLAAKAWQSRPLAITPILFTAKRRQWCYLCLSPCLTSRSLVFPIPSNQDFPPSLC